MMEYCFCYWKSDCLPTDTPVKIDLGSFKSVKAATLRVISLISADPFFSPKVRPEYRNECGALCSMDGRVCAVLYESSKNRYRWRISREVL